MNNKIQVEVMNSSANPLPQYQTSGSAGLDLQADFSKGLNEDLLFSAAYDEVRKVLLIFSGGRALIPTGIFSAIPKGYEVQIRSRSGLALKHGVTIANAPGTIDSDYRNSWGVILTNFGDEIFEVSQGDRIAQAVLAKVEQLEWKEVALLDETERGLGGYGSTGVKEESNEG